VLLSKGRRYAAADVDTDAQYRRNEYGNERVNKRSGQCS
jgi:hypothetical protein